MFVHSRIGAADSPKEEFTGLARERQRECPVDL